MSTSRKRWRASRVCWSASKLIRNGSYSAELYGAAAVDFVYQHAAAKVAAPMYLQVEYFVPHAPTNPGPPARYIPPLFEKLPDRIRANYSGMVVSMDEAVGNLTGALKVRMETFELNQGCFPRSPASKVSCGKRHKS